MTHSEYNARATELAREASVAVLVLMGAPDDVEFVPCWPRAADAKMRADIKARWPGRGLRSVGLIGLCGTSPRVALKDPLEPEQVSALADAFLAYLHSLYCDSFAAQQEGAEIQELARMWSLEDTR